MTRKEKSSKEQILAALGNSELTRKELAQVLGCSIGSYAFVQNLRALLLDGIVVESGRKLRRVK